MIALPYSVRSGGVSRFFLVHVSLVFTTKMAFSNNTEVKQLTRRWNIQSLNVTQTDGITITGECILPSAPFSIEFVSLQAICRVTIHCCSLFHHRFPQHIVCSSKLNEALQQLQTYSICPIRGAQQEQFTQAHLTIFVPTSMGIFLFLTR
uniref:Putative secreted protein n=1 Tax=Ixodes ricinus TaxID=34613 RepID=A0A6B0UVJ5_IXORI